MGGCFETSHATTHQDPTYIVDGVVHYCVANMPGAVARTSTYALNNVTLPHALKIADLGWQEAMRRNPHLAAGLNVHDGKVTYQAVAEERGGDRCRGSGRDHGIGLVEPGSGVALRSRSKAVCGRGQRKHRGQSKQQQLQ